MLFKISYVTCTGCRTNSWTTSLCSRDHCCNKSYLCFHKWRSTGYDGTNVVLAFALNTNTLVSETVAPSMLHLIVYTSMQTFKFRSVYTVQLRFQYPQWELAFCTVASLTHNYTLRHSSFEPYNYYLTVWPASLSLTFDLNDGRSCLWPKNPGTSMDFSDRNNVTNSIFAVHVQTSFLKWCIDWNLIISIYATSGHRDCSWVSNIVWFWHSCDVL